MTVMMVVVRVAEPEHPGNAITGRVRLSPRGRLTAVEQRSLRCIVRPRISTSTLREAPLGSDVPARSTGRRPTRAVLSAAAGLAAALVLTPAAAGAQPAPGLRILVEARSVRIGGDFDSGAGVIISPQDEPGTHERSFSISSQGCVVGAAPYILNEAVGGWHVWVTPVAVDDDDAVTFRIVWERSPNGNADAWNSGTEQTFTLKPGRTVPLDVISVPPRASAERTCSSARLQVQVRRWPDPEEDRRLVSTDLALVQRQADGSERTHSLTVRSLYGEDTRFHFDTLEDAGVQLEFQGVLTVQPDTDAVTVGLTTRSRVIEHGVVSHRLSDGAMMRGREVRSTLRLASDEVVTVDLPRLGENNGGAFANQTFFLRVGSRQIR